MSKDAYDRLRAEIVTGHLSPGSLLRESEIAFRYGVSRTPVREALRRLQQDGLVERRERSMVVRECGPEEILEIYTVRIVLEELTARIAAENRTALDLENLKERHLQMLQIDLTDLIAMERTNRLFHEAMWTSSHNLTLIDLLIRLNSHLTRFPVTTLASPGRWTTVLDDHAKIIDAITARDVDLAGRLANSHMSAARDVRLHLYAVGGVVPTASRRASRPSVSGGRHSPGQ